MAYFHSGVPVSRISEPACTMRSLELGIPEDAFSATTAKFIACSHCAQDAYNKIMAIICVNISLKLSDCALKAHHPSAALMFLKVQQSHINFCVLCAMDV